MLIYLRRAVIHVIVKFFGIRDVESQYRRYRGYYTEHNSADLWLFVQEQHQQGWDREQLRVYPYMMRVRKTLEAETMIYLSTCKQAESHNMKVIIFLKKKHLNLLDFFFKAPD